MLLSSSSSLPRVLWLICVYLVYLCAKSWPLGWQSLRQSLLEIWELGPGKRFFGQWRCVLERCLGYQSPPRFLFSNIMSYAHISHMVLPYMTRARVKPILLVPSWTLNLNLRWVALVLKVYLIHNM